MAASIGSRIRNIRGRESRTSFAEKLDIGTTTLQRYENDERSPDIDFLTKLQSATGYSLDYLVYGREATLPSDEALILEKYRQADEVVKNKMLMLLLGSQEISTSGVSNQNNVVNGQQVGSNNEQTNNFNKESSADQNIQGGVKIKSKGKRAQAAFNITNNEK
jgi:transcriptional regulator with XRE-family HTH domain